MPLAKIDTLSRILLRLTAAVVLGWVGWSVRWQELHHPQTAVAHPIRDATLPVSRAPQTAPTTPGSLYSAPDHPPP